jgi:hypothetical protein
MQKGTGRGHFGKKTKVGMQTKTKTPDERMHEMKTKVEMQKGTGRGHFGKKTKVRMQTKTKTPGERMHEMKTKPNNISSGCGREKKQK